MQQCRSNPRKDALVNLTGGGREAVAAVVIVLGAQRSPALLLGSAGGTGSRLGACKGKRLVRVEP